MFFILYAKCAEDFAITMKLLINFSKPLNLHKKLC